MKNLFFLIPSLAALWLGAAPLPAANYSHWQAICQRLKTYTGGRDNDADLHALTECLRQAPPAQRAPIERELAGLLRDPKTTDAAKEFICRHTAYLTSDEAVEALITLQANERFSFPACYGLQRLANAKAAAALRNALSHRVGKPLRDVIQTLGALRDEPAVPALVPLLKNADLDIARTAIVALGHIGGANVERSLADFEPGAPVELGTAVAEARLKCAAALDRERAVKVYEAYLKSPSAPLRMAAFGGLLDLQPEQRLARLMAAIQGSDPALKSVAFRRARDVGGAELAEALPKLPPAEQTIVLDILRERADLRVASAVQALVGSSDAEVRLAALSALGVVGNASHLDLLVQAAARESGKAQTTVREALARLRGSDINPALMKRVESGEGAERAECLTALMARGASDVMALLLRATDDPDARVQQAAITGVRSLAGPSDYLELLRRVLAAKPGAAQAGLQETVVALGRRDRSGAIIDSLAAAMNRPDGAARGLLIEMLGGIGGGKALTALKSALEDPEADVRIAVVRALSNWSDTAPLSDVLALAMNSTDATARLLALRGVARLAPMAQDRPPEKRVELLMKAMSSAQRAPDKKMLLAALGNIPCPDSLKAAQTFANDPELAAEAKAAIEQIRGGTKSKPRAQAAGPAFSAEMLKLFNGLDNLALGATAANLDGLQPDGAGQGAFAAIDGNPETYWDETNDQKLYRLRVQFKQRVTVESLRILGFQHHQYAPKDFEVICDGQGVKQIKGAEYRDNVLTFPLPPTACGAVELKITGYYGRSPAIRELGIYGVAVTGPERRP